MNDEILADMACARWTLNPALQSTAEKPTEFELFSDRINRMWPSYVLDARNRLRPGPETPTINLAWLKELLLSKELSRNSELEWVSNKSLKYLDGADLQGESVCLQSFPRSGNSFLRRVIELITGVYTGSDLNNNLTSQRMFSNCLGEETVPEDNNLVWIAKTHWPMEAPMGAKRWTTNKCISLVRNPIDIIPSLLYLLNTQNHSSTTNEKPNEVDPVFWAEFTKVIATGLNGHFLNLNS